MLNETIKAIARFEVKTVQGGDSLQSDVQKILTAVVTALGLVCVVAMIIGGINYITSAGDTNKAEKGKKTILYAAIGLAVSALSFAIVNWTIGIIENNTNKDQPQEDARDANDDAPYNTYSEEKIQEEDQENLQNYLREQNPKRKTYLND